MKRAEVSKCIHWSNGACGIASELANVKVQVTDEQCAKCSRDVNSVTVSLALVASANPDALIQSHGHLLRYVDPLREPVGSKLRELAPWFNASGPVDYCDGCVDREDRMNRWGVKGCRQNLASIVGWLRESGVSELRCLRVASRAIAALAPQATVVRCIHFQHGLCQIATRLGGIIVAADPAACDRCKASMVPMDRNEVTAMLAINALQRKGSSPSESLMSLAHGGGAGNVAERYIRRWLSWLHITPPANCGCESWVSAMNEWGFDGSLDRLDEITEQLYANLLGTYLAGLAIPFLTKPLIKRRIKACLLRGRSLSRSRSGPTV